MQNIFNTRTQATYGLEAHMQYWSQLQPEKYEYLASAWVVQRNKFSEKLKNIQLTFPYFSLHDASHSIAIIGNIERILGESRIRQLGATDTYLLLYCAYAHDMGMIVDAEDILNEIKSPNSKTSGLERFIESKRGKQDDLGMAADYLHANSFWQEQVNMESRLIWSLELRRSVYLIISAYMRDKHAERSVEKLNDDSTDMLIGIPSRLINCARQICSLHTSELSGLNKLDKQTDGIGADYAHPVFIALLLRLGDALDIDNNRFNPYQLTIIGKTPDDSKAYQAIHEAVSHIHIAPDSVEIRAEFNSENKKQSDAIGNTGSGSLQALNDLSESRVLRFACNAAQGLFSYIQKDLEFLAIHWSDIAPKDMVGGAPKWNGASILWDGEEIKPEDFDLKYNISHRRAAEIIEGSDLYDNEYIFIRELVQNAMDATKRQFFRDIDHQRFYNFNQVNSDEFTDPHHWDPVHIINTVGIQMLDKLSVHVNIEVNEGDNNNLIIRVTVTDNGTGIDSHDLQNMQNIGEIHERRPGERNKMPKWLQPTGSFGIGMQSVFKFTSPQDFRAITRAHDDHAAREIFFQSASHGGKITAIVRTNWGYGTTTYGTKIIAEKRANDAEKYGIRTKVFGDLFNPVYHKVADNIYQYCLSWFSNDIFPVFIKYSENEHRYGSIFSHFIQCERNYKNGYTNRPEDCFIYESWSSDKKTWHWSLDKKTLEIHIWNPVHAVYIVFNWKRFFVPDDLNGRASFHYRGMTVLDDAFPFEMPNLDCDISLWDYKAQDLLSIDRNSIKDDKIPTLKDIFTATKQTAVYKFFKHFYILLQGDDNDSLKWFDKILSNENEIAVSIANELCVRRFYPSCEADSASLDFDPHNGLSQCMEYLKPWLISKDVPVLYILNERYARREISIYDVLYKPCEKWYIESQNMPIVDIVHNNAFGNAFLPHQACIDFISPQLKCVAYEAAFLLRGDQKIYTPVYRICTKDNNCPNNCPVHMPFVKMEAPYQDLWLEYLAKEEEMTGKERIERKIIPGIEKFKALCVRKTPHDICPTQLRIMSSWIISPLTNEEVKEIHDMKKEFDKTNDIKTDIHAIRDKIHHKMEQSKTILELIKYVYENQSTPDCRIIVQQILSEYKRLTDLIIETIYTGKFE